MILNCTSLLHLVQTDQSLKITSLVQLRVLTFFGYITRKEDIIERPVVQRRVEGTWPIPNKMG